MVNVPFYLTIPETVHPDGISVTGIYRIKKSRTGNVYGSINIGAGWEFHEDLQECFDQETKLCWYDEVETLISIIMRKFFIDEADSLLLTKGEYGKVRLTCNECVDTNNRPYLTRDLSYDGEDFGLKDMIDFFNKINVTFQSWYVCQ